MKVLVYKGHRYRVDPCFSCKKEKPLHAGYCANCYAVFIEDAERNVALLRQATFGGTYEERLLKEGEAL